MDKSFFERPIAITDLECSGIDPVTHEIAEIGLILIDPEKFNILDTLDVKVKLEHLELANITPPHLKPPSGRALDLIGYNKKEWENATPLLEAMKLYQRKTEGAIFASWNMAFDYGFIAEGYRKTGLMDLMDYHHYDIFSMAMIKLRKAGLEKPNLSEAAKFLGIPPEPKIHRAMNGTMLAYEVFKRIMA